MHTCETTTLDMILLAIEHYNIVFSAHNAAYAIKTFRGFSCNNLYTL